MGYPLAVQQTPICGVERNKPFIILQKIQEVILHCPESLNRERKLVATLSERPRVHLGASVIALPSQPAEKRSVSRRLMLPSNAEQSLLS